ncbi:hypothetical protein RWV98_17575 [Agathobaculum sp. NTUH-O15-33]|uniref:hypothetical protein n=1 Tax=Agathobaculum sp. NTUH-O15-33 TaxID=3079302 RepID=UPI0029584665|nr:hypothetical protein [Agathobaculum sp. NTUH-O15-33]WNX84362.1 hypothetical protein RWV98_17575 [Agathobaculum sp. NTUH-O15-33]
MPDGIKIKITSDSNPVLKDLEKVEQKAQQTFEKAKAAAEKTGQELANVRARMDEIKTGKAAELDIGLKWEEGQFDAAIEKSAALDAEYRRLTRTAERLEQKFEQQRQTMAAASVAHEDAARGLNEHAGTTKRMNSVVQKARTLFAALAQRLGAMKDNTKKASKETKKHAQSMKTAKKAADPLSKSILRLGNMFKLMLIRMAMRKTIDGVKEGFADLAKYSTSTQEALSKLSTAFLYIRNAVTAVAKPVLEALAPVIESVAGWFGKAANNVAQFTTALFGNSNTYTQATKAAKKYGDETEKAAKKTDKALASFDDINQISIGEQEAAETPTPDDMFEEAPIDEKVQGLADKVKAFFEELRADMAGIWSVFQQSWAQSGQATIAAAKAALGSLLGAIGAIGTSFAAVWTNGTGFTLLNNLQGLLQTVLGIIGSIADAFKAAWETNNVGAILMQAIANVLNSIVSLARDIGQAFIEAWNSGGLGQSIMSNILQIVTGIFQIVGNLVERFREAWAVNENGKAIWSAILGIFNIVLSALNSIIQATAKWAAGLNLEPFISTIRNMLEALSPVIASIGDALVQIWEDTALPFLGWVLESALPALIEGLASILGFLGQHGNLLTSLTKLVIAFIAAWKITAIIPALLNMAAALGNVNFQMLAVRASMALVLIGIATFADLAYKVYSAWGNMSTFEKVVSVLGLIAIAAATAAIAISAMLGAANVALTLGAITAGVIGASAAIWAVNRSGGRSASSSSGATPRAASAYSLRSAPVPRLATGAVIPPNNEFLAVLGDQKRGTNVEAPLSTIEEAVGRALDARGGSNAPQDIVLHLRYDNSFVRGLRLELDKENRRAGVKLVRD